MCARHLSWQSGGILFKTYRAAAGESAADALGLVHGQATDLVSATKEILRRFVNVHFPVARNVKVADTEALAAATADSSTRLGKDAAAAPQERAVTVPECVRMRDELLAEIERLELPPHFLDGAPLVQHHACPLACRETCPAP